MVPKLNMDVTIQHPWFKRTLGPFYPSRLFDQFFGEGLFEYDLLPFLSSTISPYYRQSLFRTVLDSGISEVRVARGAGLSSLLRGWWPRWVESVGLWSCSIRQVASPHFIPLQRLGESLCPHCSHAAEPPLALGRGWIREQPEPTLVFLHQLMTHTCFVRP